MDIKIDEILEYLDEPRTRQEVQKKFNLNNMKSHKLLRWMLAGKFIECFSARIENKIGQKNKFYFKK